jgi:hypothetical protein
MKCQDGGGGGYGLRPTPESPPSLRPSLFPLPPSLPLPPLPHAFPDPLTRLNPDPIRIRILIRNPGINSEMVDRYLMEIPTAYAL